jgi:serine/threonine-protein kinase RsbW
VILISAHSLKYTLTNQWRRVSFASTLYLEPVLDVLLKGVPLPWRSEVRLGLQEALVNAVKHGNNLDPTKQIWVEYNNLGTVCCWVIRDQGGECTPTTLPEDVDSGSLIPDMECGRGFFILNQIFDRVQWDWQNHTLSLWKRFQDGRAPVID